MERPGANSALVSLMLYLVTHVATALAIGLLACHLVFAVDEHPTTFRVCTAIPGMLVILEIRRYLRSAASELPFLALGLLQYYLAFGFPVFFSFEFGDLSGPVFFTPETRLAGGLAIGLGALCLWGGAQLMMRGGSGGAVRMFLRVLPPAEMPMNGWRTIFLYHAAGAAAFAIAQLNAPNLIPGSLAQPLGIALAAEMPLALALALPPSFKGFLGRHLNATLLVVGSFRGLLTGMLEPIFRLMMPYMLGTWAFTRRFSATLLMALVLGYLVLQPVKAGYRRQVWGTIERTGQDVGYKARVEAWVTSFQSVWSNEKTDTEQTNRSSMERISEQAPVLHALQVVPGRVPFRDGEGFLVVFNAFIPRFIWPDKPTIGDTVLRYAMIFGRQSEKGASTTAINLPLLVEGYWNLGWPGIVIVTGVVGVMLGFSQRVFAGGHWALRAIGLLRLTNVTVIAASVVQVSSFFQTIGVFILTLWGLWWGAKMLSGRERRPVVGRRPIRLASGR